MTVRVSGKNLDIGDALRTHVQGRIASSVSKFFDGGVAGHVTIAPDGSGYRTECTLYLSSGTTLQTEGKAHEVYACFDQAADRLDRRLRRYKRRLKGHHPVNDDTEVLEASVVDNYVIEAPADDVEDAGEFAPVTIAESTSRMKRMSVSAAITELDMTGVPVVVFRHGGNDRINVVYRRSDGNIGWIDPHSTKD
jgi:ribosomal subunit interface protein